MFFPDECILENACDIAKVIVSQECDKLDKAKKKKKMK